LWLVGLYIALPEVIAVPRMWPPAFTGLLLAVVCLMQFGVSLLIDRRYEKGLGKTMFWVIWYPLVFWLVSLLTTLVSFPKVLFRLRQKRARWVSPDRGIRPPGADEEEIVK
jgi:biofilm PGA synthesis N-glycosyltransferase PgaC